MLCYCPCNPFDSSEEEGEEEEEEDSSLGLEIDTRRSHQSSMLDRCPSPTSNSRFTLEESYDPHTEYIRHYSRRYATVHKDTKPLLSSLSIDNILSEARKVLDDEKTSTPRELSRNLEKYELAIFQEKDLDKKAQLIDEYRAYKYKLDVNNREDKEQAELYLMEARNELQMVDKRVSCYQKALIYTNDRDEYNALTLEYTKFCHSMK
jgi:uncharacterized protein with von Willebrand factor type A (vWA) domain